MSIRMMGLVWESPMQNHTEKLVALAIADNANDAGVCWPSVTTIARKCDLTEQAVQKRIKTLVKAGWLKVERKPGRSNTYTIHPPTPLTPQQDLPPNAVDHTPQQDLPHPPTPLTTPPNAVDPNRKGTATEPSEEPSDATASARKERHQQFIAEWCAAYENDRGQTYRVTGRDAKAVKTLATESHDLEELVWTAQQAWKHTGPKYWNCQRAVTIYFFAEHLNEIRAELRGTTASRPVAEAERKF